MPINNSVLGVPMAEREDFTWYKEQPTNRNYLIPNGFNLVLQKFEGVDFFAQKANLPDITGTYTEVPTRFRSFPVVGGGGITYGDFSIDFIVDEDLVNYKAIHEWIRLNCCDETHMPTAEPDLSNAILFVLSSNYNANRRIEFEKIFPVSLTQIGFDDTIGTAEYITATATFKFFKYDIV